MLKATIMDHVNMTVKSIEKTVKFYKDLFGFEVKKDEDDYKIIGNDNIKLCIYEDLEMEERKGINHFGFYIKNFDEIVKNCKKLNVPILYGGEVDWEKSKSVYIKDPSGYTIELTNAKGGNL